MSAVASDASTQMPAMLALAQLTRDACRGLQVDIGMPAGQPPDEWCWYEGAVGTQEPSALNRARLPRRETYAITGYFSVLGSASDAQRCLTRAGELASMLAAALAADPSLGGVLPSGYAVLGPRYETEAFVGQGRREGRVTFEVTCQAELRRS